MIELFASCFSLKKARNEKLLFPVIISIPIAVSGISPLMLGFTAAEPQLIDFTKI